MNRQQLSDFERYAKANYRRNAKAMFLRMTQESRPTDKEWFALSAWMFGLISKRKRRRAS